MRWDTKYLLSWVAIFAVAGGVLAWAQVGVGQRNGTLVDDERDTRMLVMPRGRLVEFRCEGFSLPTDACIQTTPKVTFSGQWDDVQVCYRDKCRTFKEIWGDKEP